LSLTAGASFSDVTSGAIGLVIPGGATAWPSFRVLKVSVWGSDFLPAQATNPIGNYVAAQAPGDASFLDANTQTFEDYGVTGSARPVIHYTPAFVQRERWYSSSSTDVVLRVTNGNGSTATPSYVVLQLTLELQSANQAPAFMRFLNGPIADNDSAVRHVVSGDRESPATD